MESAGDQMVRANEPGRINKHQFKVGDKVMLHSRNYPKQRSHKLAPTYLGPYRVTEVLSESTVRLSLPDTFGGAHDVINVDQLKPFTERLQGEGEKEDEQRQQGTISAIVDSKLSRGQRTFRVRFVGTNPVEDIWIPAEQLQQQMAPGKYADLVANFDGRQGQGKRRSARQLGKRGMV